MRLHITTLISVALLAGVLRAEAQQASTPVKRGSLVKLQVGTIIGRVTDSTSSAGVERATIAITGPSLTTLSDRDGNYRLTNVPVGTHTLRAMRIGYAPATQSVTVAEGQEVRADFSLAVRVTELARVVAIGYGTAPRRDLTGSVASVTSEEVNALPVATLDQALVGRAAGVEVVTSSGQPGAGSMVRIRGGNSISAGNDPLYVVDGVPLTTNLGDATPGILLSQSVRGMNLLGGIDPGDIESIEILKDASASAIYGARGANGVVLITTKRGRAGQNTVSFGSYLGVEQVRRTLPLMNATEFATMVNTAYTNAGQTPPFPNPSSLGPGTDWQDVIFRTASMRSYEASVAGGDQRTQYYVSGSLLQSDGIVTGTDMRRGSFRLNLDRTVSNRFRLGNRLTVSRSQGKILPNAGAGQEVPSVILNALTAPPTLAVRDSGGEFFVGTNPLTGRPFPNPLASVMEITNEERQTRLIGNVYAEFDIKDGLTVRSTAGLDFLNSLQDYYAPSTVLPGKNYSGEGTRGQAETVSWVAENTLHWRRGFGERHVLDAVGGITFQSTLTDGVSATARQFLTDRLGVSGLGTGSVFLPPGTTTPSSSLLSYFARGNWSIADKYLFTLTGRIDGSTKFGPGNQYGFFPSAAVAWRASQEDFIQRLGAFDDLKLRASYGRTGNQDIGNYSWLSTLCSTSYAYGTTRAIGFVPCTMANTNLKWETTDQLDLGLDATVYGGRFSVTADYYGKTTHDLLYYVPVPLISGYTSMLQNVGRVRNRGFELTLSTANHRGEFDWGASLNLAWNRNRVLNLGPDTMLVNPVGVGAGAHQNPTILKVGQPTNAFYGWVYDSMLAGNPVYRDLDGDTAITEADRTIIGNAQPDYTGGLGGRVAYGNFELSLFVQWSVGNDIYNINRALLTSAAGNANQLKDVATGGRGIPSPRIGNTFENRPSDLFVEDGSYVRGKNIRLSYTMSSDWLRASPLRALSSLQVYVSAQNFFTITDYSGYDPEISEYATTNLAHGFDFGTYPQPRRITFGLAGAF
ncbi:MAG TPA: TonB-dependent receptor [Gemmatimonadales bacterium]|nr:TonB-dependent receptor [Gemmatimonadales bacterium]